MSRHPARARAFDHAAARAPARVPVLALLAVLVGAAAAPAQIVFEPPVSYDEDVAIFTAASIAAGDIDGDGHLDVVTGKTFGAVVRVLPGLGDGVLGEAQDVITLPGSSTLQALALVDLDADDDLDLLFTNGDVVVMLNDGTGTFAAPDVDSPTPFVVRLAVGDPTGDGVPDLVVVGQVFLGAMTMGLLPGLGDGTFGAPQHLLSTGFLNVEQPRLADLDADGADDIVLVTHSYGTAPTAHVLLSSVRFAITGVPLPDVVTRPVLADVDADGHPDLLGTISGSDQVLRMAGEGGAAFGAPASFPAGDAPRGLAVADLDGDGHLDLATANFYDEAVTVLRGDGAGDFAAVLTVSNSYEPWTVAAHDLDGDARGDLLVAGGDGLNPLQVLLNHTYEAASAYADEGGQGPGGTGFPILLADGNPFPGRPVGFTLMNAAPGSNAFLVLGFSALFAPLGAGILGPSPDVVFGPFPIGASQQFEAGGIWPAGVPAGTTLRLQYWLADPGATGGYAPTSTVRVAVP